MFDIRPEALAVQDAVAVFFDQQILPNHHLWLEQCHDSQEPAIEVELRALAKAQGLWNLALPRLTEDEPGTRLSNLEFTGVAEILGRLPWASRVFNSHAPDTPNMEFIAAVWHCRTKANFSTTLA